MSKLRSVKVEYSNGETTHTDMASHLNNEDIHNYFRIGRVFNIGDGENDLMAKVVKVIIIY
jgi:hypothetical protein|tara:strand:+ start:571 stop:753 length:183 start_codon:yes stop_codon:yes gene_type:complete